MSIFTMNDIIYIQIGTSSIHIGPIGCGLLMGLMIMFFLSFFIDT